MGAGADHLEGAWPPDAGQRLDKWLYFARLAKSRSMAAELILGGKVRVNRARVDKPSQPLRAGAVVTIALHGRVLVLKVLGPGRRRGPVAEARSLYELVSPRSTTTPPEEPAGPPEGARDRSVRDRKPRAWGNK
jgi:ribosome-associated heat shock protein Hsp15